MTAAEADIDDSIKRKHIRVSLKNKTEGVVFLHCNFRSVVTQQVTIELFPEERGKYICPVVHKSSMVDGETRSYVIENLTRFPFRKSVLLSLVEEIPSDVAIPPTRRLFVL